MSQPLTTRIPVKDRDGRVIDEKEVATYAGLLAKAHEEGLKLVTTRLLQVPTDDNGQTAIVEAVVETEKGRFAGIGDASPGNVNRRVAAHIIRMAETRAKARALRDAVNIGMVALEELGGEEGELSPLHEDTAEAPAADVRPFPARSRVPPPERLARSREALSGKEREGSRNGAPFPRGNNRSAPEAMTEAQRRWLFRYLAEQGLEGDQAVAELCRAAEVHTLQEITKTRASALIDACQRESSRAG